MISSVGTRRPKINSWRASSSLCAKAALERHHQARLELGAGAHQLLLARLLDQLQELVAHDGHQLGDLLLAGAGVDAEQAGIGVARGEGEDRVGEAALLAYLLEQSRRHAAAEHGREDLKRVEVVIEIRERRQPEQQMGLLEVAFLAPIAPLVAGRQGGRHGGRRQLAE